MDLNYTSVLDESECGVAESIRRAVQASGHMDLSVKLVKHQPECATLQQVDHVHIPEWHASNGKCFVAAVLCDFVSL